MRLHTAAHAVTTALLALAALQTAQAQSSASDTGKQIAAGIQMELTAMMAGMVETCKVAFPARSAALDTAWNDGLKTAPPDIVAYTQTAEFRSKRQDYHAQQRAQAAKPGQQQQLEEGCNKLLK